MCMLRYIALAQALIFTLYPTVLSAEHERLNAPYGLDPLSSECFSCHDDSKDQKNEFHRGHVTGIPYDKHAGNNQNFRPISELPVELIFLEGRITCVTCHGIDPHDGQILVVNNSGSALCNSCHDK